MELYAARLPETNSINTFVERSGTPIETTDVL